MVLAPSIYKIAKCTKCPWTQALLSADDALVVGLMPAPDPQKCPECGADVEIIEEGGIRGGPEPNPDIKY